QRLVGLPMRRRSATATLGARNEAHPEEVAMHAEESKRIVRRFIDEYQTGASDAAFAELLHPDVVDHSLPPGIAPGAEGVRQQFDGFRAGLRDFRATILHQVAEGDLVSTHKVFHGTHTGELLGIPPTGTEVEILVMD